MHIDIQERIWRCPIKKSCHKIPIFKNTPLFNAKILLNTFFDAFQHILNKTPTTGVINVTKCSSKTVNKWARILRKLIASIYNKTKIKIGGPGIIVEIDETKLGKIKYNRGHRIDGVWCVAGIERTNEKKAFVVPVEDRKSNTLKKNS